MLQPVEVGTLDPLVYAEYTDKIVMDRLKQLAGRMRGLRVLHINATPYGGGVSELLHSLVPMMRGLGLIADWHIISGDQAFFEATKAIHNALQGSERKVTPAQWEEYDDHASQNAAAMSEKYDVIIVHDPQPAPLPSIRGRGSASWIWRCHIDTSEAQPEAWRRLSEPLTAYDRLVFTSAAFIPADLDMRRVEVIPPAIDPVSPKNMELPANITERILTYLGIDLGSPLVTQVSRFDPWKDPLGVITAYRLARKQIPDLQLALIASMALDDPQGWDMYRDVVSVIGDDPRVHLATNLTGVGSVEVNAFQSRSTVIVQKSIREGFGLVVSEALWKGTPVIAGRTPGIELQAADGAGAVFIEDADTCAAAIVDLVRDRERAGELGRRGQERISAFFLLPRLLLDDLSMIHNLVSGGHPGGGQLPRDPVCGMVLPHVTATTLREGAGYSFCSDRCRALFTADSARYLLLHPAPTGAEQP